MKHPSLLLLVLLGAVALPQSAWANAGTPLMWAGMLHLTVGNLLIGIGEGLLLAWLFSTPKGKSVAVMIAANYFSAWGGGVFINSLIVHMLPMDLINGWRWFWFMVVVTYGLTLVLEWPFVAWCFRGRPDWLKRSVRASFVVQSTSYVLLFGWYGIASVTTLFTKVQVAAPSELSLPESVLVYYIGTADGDVYSRHLTGGGAQKVRELHATGFNDRLVLRPATSDTNRWDLVARLETADFRVPRLVPVLTELPVEAARERWATYNDAAQPPSSPLNFGKVPQLAAATNSLWGFRTGGWAADGLQAWHKNTNARLRFAYETPFGSWTIRNAVHLPTDKVLFQLGQDQICAFDPATRRVALLWR